MVGCERILVELTDFMPEETRAREARERFVVERLRSADDPLFHPTFDLLEQEFLPRGEIEDRMSLAYWLENVVTELTALDGAKIYEHYFALVARDQDGRIAAVRDGFVSIEPDAAMALVMLSHIYVVPGFRRSGVAGLMRLAPLALAREALRDMGLVPERFDLLLAAEMSAVDPGSPETIVRFVAYGRAGFSLIPPSVLPYCQIDARGASDENGLQGADSYPALVVIRRPGHERDGAIPAALARAFLRHSYASYASYCRGDDLGAPLGHALEALGTAPEIPLVVLPSSLEDHERITPLLQGVVWAHHLPAVVETARLRKRT